MDPAEEYRRRAEDCRRLARLMPTARQRRMMLDVAEHWQELACGSGIDPDLPVDPDDPGASRCK
jgi:hypothetical protein